MRHLDVLERAKTEALRILQEDPGLESDENKGLKKRVEKLFGADIALDL